MTFLSIIAGNHAKLPFILTAHHPNPHAALIGGLVLCYDAEPSLLIIAHKQLLYILIHACVYCKLLLYNLLVNCC